MEPSEGKVTRRPKNRGAPGKTMEARENELISLAYDLAKKQLTDGTATSQVQTEFLRMGSARGRLEKKRLEKEIEHLEAKVHALESMERREELMEKAIQAMRKYGGNSDEGEVLYDED